MFLVECTKLWSLLLLGMYQSTRHSVQFWWTKQEVEVSSLPSVLIPQWYCIRQHQAGGVWRSKWGQHKGQWSTVIWIRYISLCSNIIYVVYYIYPCLIPVCIKMWNYANLKQVQINLVVNLCIKKQLMIFWCTQNNLCYI